MKFNKIISFGIKESELDSTYWNIIESLTETIVKLPKDSQEIKKQLADADCLLVNFGIKIDKEIIDIAPNLKYIGVLSTAYDKIDFEYARSKVITVCNIPGYSTEAVAEFVFAIILEHLRDLEKGKRQARNGNYSESGFSAIEIKNKKFGVLGLGRIGNRVAEIALGFGADVKYWSRNRKSEFENKGIKYEDFNVLIPKCDFLSLHLSLTKDTENFLNKERIQKIKKGAIVVNTAPMELIDINALEERLKKGDITFIWDHSDLATQKELNRLSKCKNCITYPPIGYITKEARIAKQEIFIKNIENFLKGTPFNKVN